MLEFNNVSKTFAGPAGEVRAIRDLTLSVPAGQFVAVQGPSGSGKTTLLLMAGALLQPTAGEVLIDGQDPYRLGPDRRSLFRAEHIGFVFQQFHLVPYLNVLENVLAPSVARPLPDAHERARELIQRFNLNHRISHVPAELSTGERQRVALARALLNRPKLLLADEPTGNLDDENARVVLDAMRDFSRDGGAVLLVTHDAQAAGYAQRIVRLSDGMAVGETA